MNNILQFSINHWPLLATLIVLIIILIIEETKTTIQGVTKISPNKTVDLVNHQNAVIIDVSNQEQFKSGHITDSINVPFNKIKDNLDNLTKYKNKPIIMVCYSGQTSLRAGIILKKNNFANVFSLSGGILEWKKIGLPLIKS